MLAQELEVRLQDLLEAVQPQGQLRPLPGEGVVAVDPPRALPEDGQGLFDMAQTGHARAHRTVALGVRGQLLQHPGPDLDRLGGAAGLGEDLAQDQAGLLVPGMVVDPAGQQLGRLLEPRGLAQSGDGAVDLRPRRLAGGGGGQPQQGGGEGGGAAHGRASGPSSGCRSW